MSHHPQWWGVHQGYITEPHIDLAIDGQDGIVRPHDILQLACALKRSPQTARSLLFRRRIRMGALGPLLAFLTDQCCRLQSLGLHLPPKSEPGSASAYGGPLEINMHHSDMQSLAAAVSANTSLRELSIVGYALAVPAVVHLTAAHRLVSLELGEISPPSMNVLARWLGQPDHRCTLSALHIVHPHPPSDDLLALMDAIILHNVSLTSVAIQASVDNDDPGDGCGLQGRIHRAQLKMQEVMAQNRLVGRRCLDWAGRAYLAPREARLVRLSLPAELTDSIVRDWLGLSDPEWWTIIRLVWNRERPFTPTAAQIRRHLVT